MKIRLSLLTSILLVVGLACGLGAQEAATPTASPMAASETIPSESSPTVTISPAASATSAPATDGSGIELAGPDEFVSQTQAALDLLASCDPEALAIADTYLESIMHSDRSGMDVGSGTFLASDTTAFAPGYTPENQVFWFAGSIVHDARHRWQAENGMTSNWDEMSLEQRQEIEHDARGVQIDTLENCLPELPEQSQPQAEHMLSYLIGMQTGDIPCDYCEVEWADRDW